MRFLRFETKVRPAQCVAAVGIWLAMLMSFGAQALEVGNLQVQSRLNEPLRAQMRVEGTGPAGQRGLDVRVADQATYEQLGLVRGSAVENLQFDLTPDADGDGIRVDVRGSRAVREPYVVLLLDVRAPTGRALREFTVLLDPGPLRADAQSANPGDDIPAPQQGAVPAPEVSSSAAQARLPAPDQPAAASPDPGTAPSEALSPSTVAAGNAPVISPQDFRNSSATERVDNAVSGGDAFAGDESRYGPVRRGESLSSIAQAIANASGVPVAQVIWSLYAENPENFANGDINNLKVGAVFDVPPTQAMLEVSVAEARRNIRDAGAGRTDARPQLTREPVDPPGDVAQAAAPGDEAAAGSSAAAAPSDAVREASGGGGDAAAPSRTQDPASERLESTIAGFDNTDMDEDAGVLPEGQFGDPATTDTAAADPAQGMTDEGSAPAAGGSAGGAPGAGSAADDAAAPGPSPAAGGLALLNRYWLVIVVAIALLLLLFVLLMARAQRRKAEALRRAEQEAMSQPRPDLVSLARGEPIPEPTARPMAAAAATAGVAAASADDDAVERVSFDDAPLSDGSDASDSATEMLPAVDESMLDMPTDDTPAAPDDEDAAFAALLADEADLAAPGDDADDLANATLDTFDVDFGEDPGAAADDSAAQGTSAATDASSPSMFETASFPLVDDDSLKSPAVSSDDPVAEAEFQLAYGLYDEAEQTLKAVLEREPDRLDAQEKLAEVYFAAGRESEFEALAMGLKREQSDTQQFRNVEKLAQQFIPHSALFDGDSAESSTSDVAEDAPATPSDDGNSIDFALDDVDAADTAPASTADASGRDEDPLATVEFSLDDVAATGVTTAAADEQDLAARHDAAADMAEADATDVLDDESTSASADDDSFALDDFALDDDNLELADLDDSSAESADAELDFSDLEDSLGDDALNLDEMVEEDAPLAAGEDSSDADLELDDFELAAVDDAGEEAPTAPTADAAEPTPASQPDDELSFDAFDDGMAADGDMNSKLDLARGYVDMGEIDMARSLLDEVATRGSADQQVEARAMLDALS